MAQESLPVHDSVTCLRFLGILLGLSPFSLLKIQASLQTIYDTHIGRVLICAPVASQELLGSIKVLEYKLESLIPFHALSVARLLYGTKFVGLNGCKGLRIHGIRL